MNFLTNLFATLGEMFAKATSTACYMGLWDEEEMPEELL